MDSQRLELAVELERSRAYHARQESWMAEIEHEQRVFAAEAESLRREIQLLRLQLLSPKPKLEQQDLASVWTNSAVEELPDGGTEKQSITPGSHKPGSLMNVARAMMKLNGKFEIDGIQLMDKLLFDFEAKYPDLAPKMDPTRRQNRFRNGTVDNYCRVMCVFPDAKDTMKRAIDLAKMEKAVLGSHQVMGSSRQCQISLEYSEGRVEEQVGMAIPFKGFFIVTGST
ncbi:uncharacterized protein PAC_17040 [Phialocephala subalpina]|uniref:Uncharacterized protein n=1 Tax=Phialocephala subalpina TaxID=576137 RepID=A0A1L7XQ19_9HELO|nr:uncharacterized protein PAC_17040 [Phialocephala subalpina]